jgi:hypothetical protein
VIEDANKTEEGKKTIPTLPKAGSSSSPPKKAAPKVKTGKISVGAILIAILFSIPIN